MSKKKPLVIEVDKHKNLYWDKTKNPLVSKTLNIYANALKSCLCISSAGPFSSVNLPSRVLNLEGFSWQKGYRNPLASISYTKTYQKFLEALRLITVVRKKRGGIYVIFDGDELRPPSSFLDPQKIYSIKKHKQTEKKNSFDPKGPLLPQGTNFRSKTHREQGSAYQAISQTLPDIHKRNFGPKAPNLSSNLLENKGQDYSISWSGDKWVGGTFSNFKQVSKSINLYKTLSRQFLDILESQTSPRYFVMAKKYHGNLFSSKKISSAFLLHKQSGFWRDELPKEGAKQGSSFASPARYGMQDLAQRSFYFGSDPRPVVNMNLKDNLLVRDALPAPLLKVKSSRSTREERPIAFSASLAKQSMQGPAKKKGLKSNLPDLIIIENAEKYKNIIAEAETLKIPVIAFVESEILSNISIALPLNALKHYFLAFLLYIIYKMPSNDI